MEKILIVDDSRFIRKYLKGLLKKNGYSIFFEAEDGEEALEKYIILQPDIVILDITLPKMQGITVLQKMKEIDAQANVIMCSSLSTKFNIMDALQLGARGFVTKPRFHDLIDVIEKI